jgi:hypothetical protein
VSSPADLVVPGAWLAAGGILFAIVSKTVGALRAVRAEFVPRAECALSMARVDDAAKRMEATATALAELRVAFGVYDERSKWLVRAVDSVMRRVGANGVPPPPDL